jgi:protein-L-isoaspartate(D-aspartate) O-methyltransferase
LLIVDYALARRNMVESQLKPNKIIDERVIDAMSTVPRELFVPPRFRGVAYVDEDVPIADGRHLMEPTVLARLLQAARITDADAVAVIGCGTGYTAAVIAHLSNVVVAVESVANLVDQASGILTQLGADNVVVMKGALDKGIPAQAPYDVIIVDGAVDKIPAALTHQLDMGGRLVAVVTDRVGLGIGTLVTRIDGGFARQALFDASVPRLPDFVVTPGFAF